MNGINLIACMLFCSFLTFCNQENKREIISLNGPWTFLVDTLNTYNSEDYGVLGLPGKFSRTVSVPHTWNVEKGLEKYVGRCWYERKFEVSKVQLSKTTRIQFNGVYHDAIIYVNGKKAGEHMGSGYNRFYITVTPYLNEGVNTLTVSVDNSFSRTNIPFANSFDWANDGGIYRDVYEVITNKEAIRNVKINAVPNGNKGLANVNISFIDTTNFNSKKISLKATITEENQTTGDQIFDGELNGLYEKGSIITSLTFDKINLWHFDSPNLYKMSVKLFVDGIEKDEYSTIFGFRSIEVKNNRFLLNNEPMRLMGVEWMPGSSLEHGMAETHADFDKNLELMKNVNCIYTRFHWQQDEYVMDWCDRHGILVQEEIPFWGAETLLNDTLVEKGFQHLDEMTDDHFNHPSIISWGIGNELDSRNKLNISAIEELYSHAKELDSSRLVNYVSNGLGRHQLDYQTPDASDKGDVLMFNDYYTTWYGQNIDVIPYHLDTIRKNYPNEPLIISEWGLCEPVHKGGDPRRAKEMVQQILFYGSQPNIAGAIYFCLNDYRTFIGEDFTYSYPQRVHGVCDIKLNPKPSYEVLKQISSPISIKEVTQTKKSVKITLAGNIGIPSYTIRNYSIVSGNEKLWIDELKPGEEKTFEIKTAAKQISIFRSTGYEVLKISLQ